MTDPYFFGYGSLVNRKTHTYPEAVPARISGWRRHWRQIASYPRAILTAVPDAQNSIDGLIARVPGNDWGALDEREEGYDRVIVSKQVAHSAPTTGPIALYEIPPTKHPAPPSPFPIALSYLDVVVQGYLQEFGETGAKDFFATTTGWHAGVVDDRHDPVYPRAQILSAGERAFVDAQRNRVIGAG